MIHLPWLLLLVLVLAGSDTSTAVPHCARYNFFLAMPIICVGMFDRDINQPTLERFRWTYMSGRENMDLNVRNMALWLVQVRG